MADILLGGQAVMEGVMMRRPGKFAVAVRTPAGDIRLLVEDEQDASVRYPVLKLPIVRGVYTLVSTLRLGFRALTYSADIALNDTTESEAEHPKNPWYMPIVIIGSVLIAVGVFLVLPVWLTELLSSRLAILAGSSLAFNLVEGVLRLGFFLLYILTISLMPDIRRFFRYHGAEHQTIYAYENHEELTVANVRTKSPRHPRCGTSFIMTVVVVAMLLFSLIPSDLNLALKAAARLVLIPFVAGLSYEIIRYSARTKNQILFKLMAAPGLWLQRLTTDVPDDSMLEVAIASLSALLPPQDRVESLDPVVTATQQ